jgi:type IV fimbrial biogenesis protein FimT
MMVVVLIITLSAAIAMPGIAKRMKANRAKMAAEKIATIYRTARMRAMGRGSAVLVRYNSGVITVREAIAGDDAIAAGCEKLPASSCLTPTTRWGNLKSQQISSTDFVTEGDFLVSASVAAPVIATYDICFSPSGRTYSRDNVANNLAVMGGPLRVDVLRADGVGFRRSVVVTPAGTARTVANP